MIEALITQQLLITNKRIVVPMKFTVVNSGKVSEMCKMHLVIAICNPQRVLNLHHRSIKLFIPRMSDYVLLSFKESIKNSKIFIVDK